MRPRRVATCREIQRSTPARTCTTSRPECWSSTSHFGLHKITTDRQEDKWRRQLWGTGARAPPPPTSNIFIFSLLWSKSDSQLSKYFVVCEISWCRCQQLTALSISTALSHKTISHRAAAAVGPEVRRECPMSKFTALPLATPLRKTNLLAKYADRWNTELGFTALGSLSVTTISSH